VIRNNNIKTPNESARKNTAVLNNFKQHAWGDDDQTEKSNLFGGRRSSMKTSNEKLPMNNFLTVNHMTPRNNKIAAT